MSGSVTGSTGEARDNKAPGLVRVQHSCLSPRLPHPSSADQRMVRILATDAREIIRILDNDLSHGLYDDATEWKYTQLLARLNAGLGAR